jgi:hypothetical protein
MITLACKRWRCMSTTPYQDIWLVLKFAAIDQVEQLQAAQAGSLWTHAWMRHGAATEL